MNEDKEYMLLSDGIDHMPSKETHPWNIADGGIIVLHRREDGVHALKFATEQEALDVLPLVKDYQYRGQKPYKNAKVYNNAKTTT